MPVEAIRSSGFAVDAPLGESGRRQMFEFCVVAVYARMLPSSEIEG